MNHIKHILCKKAISIVLALSLALLPCLTLVSCHGQRGLDAFVMPDSFDETQQIEIKFWAKNDTNKTQVEIYKKAISEFEALYPNVKVTMLLYTDYSRIYNDVITNITTGTTPDVCITYPDHIATYITGQNTVVPLDELATDSKYGLGGSEVKFDSPTLSEIVPQFLNECYVDGTLYAMPFMRSTEACYVNKTMVEKLGFTLPETLTWDFIWEVSEAAMAKDEEGNYLVNGQKVLIPFIYKSTDNMMIQYSEQAGTGYATADGEVELFNDTTTEFLKAVAEHVSTGAFSTFKISSYPGNYLNAGQCIFAIDSTAGATWMGCDAPLGHQDIASESVVDFEMVVMSVPQLDTDNPKMISQGPSVCIFNKEDPMRVMASWLFVQYLLTNDVQISYSQTEGYVPVTLKAQQSETYRTYLSLKGTDTDEHYYGKIDAAEILLDNISSTFVTPVFNGSASLRSAAGELIEATALAVKRKTIGTENFYSDLYENVTSLYHLDQMGNTSKDTDITTPMPAGAKALIITLGVVWCGIIGYVVRQKAVSKQRRKKSLDK